MKSFEQINNAYRSVFQPGKMTLGVFFAIESYSGSVPNMLNQVELAKRAEEVGFSALWFRDVPMHVPAFGDVGQIYDPWVYMGYIAAHTTKIALITGSIILPLRHPIHVAKAASSIDQLSKGRLILGVASGDRPQEYPAFNTDIKIRAELFQDAFHTIRQLNGDFPHINSLFGKTSGDIDLLPKSTGNRIPLLVTGHSGQNVEWIAKNSDGWIYYPRNIRSQETLVNQWRSTLKNLDLVPKPFSQSFYIDLVENPLAEPTSIHLGYRLGRNWLLKILYELQSIGVNHIVFNLKYGSRRAADVIEELGEFILPHFNADIGFSKYISDPTELSEEKNEPFLLK
jgi:luciferase-type oxidoreductase